MKLGSKGASTIIVGIWASNASTIPLLGPFEARGLELRIRGFRKPICYSKSCSEFTFRTFHSNPYRPLEKEPPI